MKQKVMLISLIGSTILIAIIKIAVENAFSTSGIQYGTMQQQAQALQKQNMILSEKLYAQTSLTHLASEAATMGFVPDGKLIAVTSTKTVAYSR